MPAKWRKTGARIIGREQVLRKIDGKLNDWKWDLLPLGKKISDMEGLLSALKDPQKRRGSLRFLSLADEETLRKIEPRILERLEAEKRSLEDLREVFSHWRVDLGKVKLKPGDISYPLDTDWARNPGTNLVTFASPSMARWFEENVEKKSLQPSYIKPPSRVVNLIKEKKAFGLSRRVVTDVGKARVGLLQPLVFYQTGEGIQGKRGTPHTLPLAHPDLLMFYAQLKDAKAKGFDKLSVYAGVAPAEIPIKTRRGVKKLHVAGGFSALGHTPPYQKIYDRILQLSHGTEKEGGSMFAVFRKKVLSSP